MKGRVKVVAMGSRCRCDSHTTLTTGNRGENGMRGSRLAHHASVRGRLRVLLHSNATGEQGGQHNPQGVLGHQTRHMGMGWGHGGRQGKKHKSIASTRTSSAQQGAQVVHDCRGAVRRGAVVQSCTLQIQSGGVCKLTFTIPISSSALEDCTTMLKISAAHRTAWRGVGEVT